MAGSRGSEFINYQVWPMRLGPDPGAQIRAPPSLRVLWKTAAMLREPTELEIGEDGRLELPIGVLAEAGLNPGARIVAYSAGDGRIVLRRAEDALTELVTTGSLT